MNNDHLNKLISIEMLNADSRHVCDDEKINYMYALHINCQREKYHRKRKLFYRSLVTN